MDAEHEVEGVGFAEFFAGFRAFDAEGLNDVVDVGEFVVGEFFYDLFEFGTVGTVGFFLFEGGFDVLKVKVGCYALTSSMRWSALKQKLGSLVSLTMRSLNFSTWP